ncbi:MAG TPA: DUF2846 domain-containing protein [Pyrinomonadaceae bacterium]
MFKIFIRMLSVLALLSGCTQLGPTPAATQAVHIDGTPGKAVVYVVRTRPDMSYLTAPIMVDDTPLGATYAGTYMRLELTPGQHVLRGYAQDNGSIKMNVQADRVYFVQHSVAGSWRVTSPHSFFTVIDEARARAAMVGASLAGAGST